MKKLFLLFVFLTCFFGQAQHTTIPDANFEKALIDLGIDSGTIDGKVLTVNISTITKLDIQKKAIQDLTGIEDFLSLENLQCSVNNLTTLDLSKNTALTDLYISSNKLRFLDVSKNLNLTVLICDYNNNLGGLDISSNTNLKFLHCFACNIFNLDVSNNLNLTELNCARNNIKSLGLSKNLNLTELNCASNMLTSLDVSKNTNLKRLNCSFNQILNLDVSKNTTLPHLNCEKNQISILDVSKNINLTNLYCGRNQISDLDVSKNLNLTVLTCSYNKLSSLDVSKTQLLDGLYCGDNKLSSLDVSKNTALTRLACQNNQISVLDVSANTDLNFFLCDNNQLLSLDVSKNPKIDSLYCNNNLLTDLNLKNGNNKNIALSYFNLKSNPKLTCIQVDNQTYSDTNWSTKKDATARYSEDCSKTAAITSPVITATGNQTFCAGTSLNIVETVNISLDPLDPDPNTDAVYIQISSGYVLGQDQLILAGSHPSIITSWSSTEGKLVLKSSSGNKIPYADFESAIKDVQFTNSNTSPSGIRTFSISLGTGDVSYLPRNGHYYQYVANLGINWTKARDLAAASNFYGLQGYLATLTAADEAQLAGAQAPGAGWIGGSDAQTEGTWKWVTGPEAGTTFWIGKGNGATTPPFNYANWNTSGNEPNDSGNNEDYAHITAPALNRIGTWNDLPEQGDPITNVNYYPKGYIVEYGGMPGDPTSLQISASTKITIPKITSTTPSSRCDSGSITLEATASDGIVNWYTSITNGVLLHTGNSYTIPNLAVTTTYYVDASNGSCPNGPRTPIIATINTTPTITATTPSFRCDSGTVTLGATASAGIINWYNVPTGGTSLGTGTSFTTPNLTSTTIYYVDATASGCTTPTRTAIIATVNISPTITSTTPAIRCDSGTVTLGATASAGTINWYDALTGGTSLGTGNTFTTPSLSATTTYYVDATATGCTTPTRTAVIATVNIPPSITATTPNSRCDSGSVTLGASASSGTINWYDSLTAGTLLGTGTLFATPNLTTTTTYYVDATALGCTTATRTPIIATVNSTPSITSTTPTSRCDTGSVTLEATASFGTINWYDVSTGGSSLGTGIAFTTPSLTTSTTYYVESTLNGCTSPRVPVLATIYPVISLTNEVVLCQSETATLTASISGMDYLWSPGGETTQSIDISNIGDYKVIISSPLANCDSKEEFKVIEHPEPIIKEIVIVENSITIELENPEDYYEFSIDGQLFVDFNHFSRIPSGLYTASVRDKNGCNLVEQDFSIFSIAKYFTPNNDGFNDVWEIKEMKNFPSSTASIFDRYGKLLATLNALKPSWNGIYNNNPLKADDYWYVLKMEDSKPEIKGHFSLKR